MPTPPTSTSAVIHLLKHPNIREPSRQSYLAQSHATYHALKNHVATTLSVPPSTVFVHKTPNGKPSLHWHPKTPQPIAATHISVSHCHRFSAWTIQPSPCALDLELIVPRRQQSALTARLFLAIARHPSTDAYVVDQLHQHWQTLDPEKQCLTFYSLWTFAECWCKWHGQTLWQIFRKGMPFPWPNINAMQQNATPTSLMTDSGPVFVKFYRPTDKHVLCSLSISQYTHLQTS